MQSFLLDVETGDISEVTTKERLESLDARAARFESRMTEIEARLGITIPERKSAVVRAYKRVVNYKGTALIIAVIAILASIFGPNLYRRHLEHQDRDFDASVDGRIDNKLSPISTKLNELAVKLGEIKGSLDILKMRVSITDSAQYIKRGEFTLAVKAAEEANRAIHEATVSKAPAPPEFFKQVSDVINSVSPRQPELSTKFGQLRISLATYRSALNPFPSLPKQTAELPTTKPPFNLTMALYRASTSVVLSPPKPVVIVGYGTGIDCTSMKPGQEIFIPATRSLDENPATVRGLTLVGATQTLDYMTWEDVTFVNTHIKYLSGPVRLRSVRFVNCTFDLPTNNVGQQVAQYAALEPKQELRIG